jgi:peptidoglycan/LPS O-acetylase OafA/YrhL
LVLLAGGVRLNSKHYRPDIDGLRAVAVVGVVAFHAYPFQVPGGFVAVDIFFVISGFLITSIITKEMEERTFSFATFYARRARRIFPALAVVLVTLLGAGWFLLLADEYAAVGKHTAAGAGFVSNIVFFQEAGYFDTSARFKPLLHLWSLGIEEQFYLIWPALLLLGAQSRGWRWIAGALAAASLAYCFWLTPRNGYAAFFLPLARFWELMVGAF